MDRQHRLFQAISICGPMRRQLHFFLYIFIFSALPGTTVLAQRELKIKGALTDHSGTALGFATISIEDVGTKVQVQLFAAEDGTFEAGVAGAGRYRVVARLMGYLPADTTITLINQSVDLGIVALSADEQQLTQVTITGNKALVTAREDKLVYHATNDPANKAGSAVDVLRKAPLLSVNAEGQVAMRGNGNLKILINGKATGQVARNPADVLSMIPASAIHSVEIISSASAKYDAEGATGVINIITQKGTLPVEGRLELVAGNQEQAINPRIDLNSGKWRMNMQAHLHRLQRRKEIESSRTTFFPSGAPARLRQASVYENVMPHGSLDLSLDYEATPKHHFQLTLNSWFGNWPDNNRVNNTWISPDQTAPVIYQLTNDTRAPYLGGELSLAYDHTFDRSEQKLSLLVQGLKGKDHFNYISEQTDEHHYLIHKESNESVTAYDGLLIQGDYVQPLGNQNTWLMETGIKTTLRHARNAFALHTAEAEGWLYQPDRSDVLDYRQDIGALYLMLKYIAPRQLAVQSGLRGEATYIKGRLQDSSKNFNDRFFNLVPFITVSKGFGAHLLKLSYNQRITRPDVWDMNVNADTRDPLNIKVGNPELSPEIMHQTELMHSITTPKGDFFNSSLYARLTGNSIQEIVYMDAAGITYRSKQNLQAMQQYGLNFSGNYQLLKGWTLGANLDVYRLQYSIAHVEGRRSGLGYEANMNMHCRLPASFAVQLFGAYTSKVLTAQGQSSDFYFYSFAFKKDFEQGRLGLSLHVNNPFAANISQTQQVYTRDFESGNTVRYYSRAFKLMLYWNFGAHRSMQKKSRLWK